MHVGRRNANGFVYLMLLTVGACAPAVPVDIIPDMLPNGVVGGDYLQFLSAPEVDSPTWNVSAGNLPPGLNLDASTGAIQGTPTQDGAFDFTVTVSSGFFRTPAGQASYTLTVLSRLAAAGEPSVGRVGEAYQFQFSITGGVPPYDSALVGLPAGLTFDSQAGTITGTPVVASINIPLELTVLDSGQPQQSTAFLTSLTIKPRAVTITTSELPTGRLNVAYTAQVQAQDGLSPYYWAVISGVLPEGLRLSLTAGTIIGTPRALESQTFQVQVTDSDSPTSTDTQTFTLTIEP